MYKFIFNFFYRYFKKRRDFGARFSASLIVFSTVFFQFTCIASFVRLLTGFNIFGKGFSEDYFTNKLCLMPFGFVLAYVFVFYYSQKRAMSIVNEYPNDYNIYTIKNILLVILILVVPLLLTILFIKLQS